MAKRSGKSIKSNPEESGQTFRGPKASDIGTVFGKILHAKKAVGDAQERVSKIVNDAADTKHFHKGATMLGVRFDRMDTIKRAEFLFHFDLLREARKWDVDDMLPDRKKNGKAEDDPRPRNLRQPGAGTPAAPSTDTPQ